jgi:hypothetical protein
MYVYKYFYVCVYAYIHKQLFRAHYSEELSSYIYEKKMYFYKEVCIYLYIYIYICIPKKTLKYIHTYIYGSLYTYIHTYINIFINI